MIHGNVSGAPDNTRIITIIFLIQPLSSMLLRQSFKTLAVDVRNTQNRAAMNNANESDDPDDQKKNKDVIPFIVVLTKIFCNFSMYRNKF